MHINAQSSLVPGSKTSVGIQNFDKRQTKLFVKNFDLEN